MSKVSVIMPVYNSEKYVGQAIESVLNQTFTDFELILINDGSTDKSGEICVSYAEKDSRIRVVSQSNQGLCAARNRGLSIATGEYIGFIDNDDYYYKNLIEDNYKIARQYNADVIRFDRLRIQTFDDNKKCIEDVTGTKGMIQDGETVAVLHGKEIIQNYERIKKSGALYGVWNALFKRDFLKRNQLQFNTSIKFGGEDGLLNLQALECAECYVFHKGVYYQYERRYGNSTSTKFNKNRLEAIEVLAQKDRELIEKIDNNGRILLYNQTDYAIGVIQILSHPNCKWTRKQKYAYLDFLQKNSALKNINYRQYEKDIYRCNFFMGVMTSIFYRKKYFICFLVVNGYMVMEKYFKRR